MADKSVYFAASRDPKDVASSCMDKAKSFYNVMEANSYLDKVQRMWRAYSGAYTNYLGTTHGVNFTGEQGELVQLPVNHFRNLARHMYNMVTSNRLVLESRAINNDYKSLAQTYLANGILDYYMREKKLEDALKRACEMAIVLGAGFVKLEWNALGGDPYDVDPDTGEMIREGEIEVSNLSVFDVVVDGTKEKWDKEWVIVRSFKNRYDLIAKYPEYTDKLVGMPGKVDAQVYRLAIFSNDDTDQIPVYEFYHSRTDAMPEGRYTLFVDSDTVLLDQPLPYRTVPIFRIAPSDIMGTPYGYSDMFDVFPIQECINSTFSAIMTNQNAFAVQNVFVKHGSDLNVNSLQGGLNVIEGAEAPIPLNLTQSPAEVFKFLEILIQTAETISGVNSVARGNPEASLKSGTALALVQSMALQFISSLQQSYVQIAEDVGTSLIAILKDFANTPKMVALVGRNNRTYLKEFTGEQISSINRVIVDVGNPLSKTIAGRIQMAEQLLQMQLLKTPEEYFQVMNTGRIDKLYQGEMQELLLVQSENEKLLNGEQPQAAMLDSHRLHITEHKSVLSDPDLRQDPNLVQQTLAHIQEHINYLKTTDPDLLNLIGEKPIQAPPEAAMGQAPEGAPGQPPPMSQGPQGGGGPSGVMQMNPFNNGKVQGPNGQGVNVPNLPKVNSSMLPNPGLQQEAMHNVRNK